MQLQNAQTAHRMKEKDCVNVLIKFFFYISFENMEKFGVKKLIFSGGVEIHPPLYLKG